MNVLNEMLLLGLKVEIIPIKSKKQVIETIMSKKYDVLVSNGCPYILPVSEMGKHTFVNVHPSILPFFKGKSPILEAIKEGGPFGVTCHLMIDKVDSGHTISQILVHPNINDLNECYREMFKAEAKVFRLAYQKGFK